jgi:hypothetical protein
VSNIVADFHVLDALGRGQRQHAECPSATRPAAENQQARADVQRPLEVDRSANIGGVGLAEGVFDFGTDRVECGTERVDLVLAQVCVLGDIGDGDGVSSQRRPLHG